MSSKLPLYGLQVGGIPRSRARATLTSTFTDENGAALMPRGTNQGNWGENYEIDAAEIASYGANTVRILLRVLRDADAEVTDSYSQGSIGQLLQTNYVKFMNELDWLEAQGLYIIVAVDTDYGAGTRGLGTSDWNFFDTTDTANQARYTQEFYNIWEYVVRNNMRRKRILAWELLPEPLPTGSNASHGPILKAWYSALITRIRAIDPTTPLLIGGRGSYALNTMSEVVFTERNDIIYTADFLTNKVQDEDGIAASLESVKLFRDTYGKPVLIQQFGRNTSDDEGNGTTTDNLGLTALNGGLSLLRTLGIPFTHWQFHQNSINPDAYALWYKIDADIDADDNWAPKLNEILSFSYHMNQSASVMEADAIAVAQALGAELYYIKSDLSNVWQTNDTSTPCTTIGQQVGRINPVVGSSNLNQATSTLRPLLAAGANNYAMAYDQVDDWLGLNNSYFSGAESECTVIVAGRAPTGSVNRVMFHAGTSGSIVRFPFLAVLATDEYSASWRGDDNVLRQCNSTTLGDNRAFVCGARKSAASKKVSLQGVMEGTEDTNAVGSIASMTRARLGSTSSGTNNFGGPISLLFICKTAITDDQYRTIARFGAYLAGAPFRGAIPDTPPGSLLAESLALTVGAERLALL